MQRVDVLSVEAFETISTTLYLLFDETKLTITYMYVVIIM